jgi:hypothetical protein
VISESTYDSSIKFLFRFGSLERPIELRVEPQLIENISRLTSGWRIEAWNGVAQAPAISLRVDQGYFIITADWLEDLLDYTDETDAICTFFVQLLAAYSQSRPDLLMLHAAAATVAGKLIAFPAEGKVGKSTLTAVLAAKGCTIFSDDALPVSLDRGTASALGIAPRPRLPLPESLKPATRIFIENHIGLSNDEHAYLALTFRDRPSILAPRGAELPIGAFVIPDRVGEPHPPQLLPASSAETMAQLIGQHLGKRPPAREMVEKLAALTGRIPCRRLRYSSVEDATDFLLATPSFAAQ